MLCERRKKLSRTQSQCSSLLFGLLKVLELLFFMMLNIAQELLGGVRYLPFPICRNNQINKVDAGDHVIIFCFTFFNGSGSHL